MTPRIALLTPFAFPSVRGNAVTVGRIARGLCDRGLELAVWDLSVTPERVVAAEVVAFRPTVIHAFHAYRAGPVALGLGRRAEISVVVTLTGTDANHDLVDPERAAVVRDVLEGAAAVTVFHPSTAERIAVTLPHLRARLVTVPQAVALPVAEPFDLDGRWTLPVDRTLFVFPAGIRMVKNPRFPLAPLGRLVSRYPQVRLLYVGPVLDPGEGETLLRALEDRPWARHFGTVPHARMGSLLARADVVLNCSLSEGGMANSILEALAAGRAVLASDIEGNRSLIQDGRTGHLFGDEREFEGRAEALIRDPHLRARLGAAGRAMVEEHYPAAREIDGYVDLYRRLSGAPAT